MHQVTFESRSEEEPFNVTIVMGGNPYTSCERRVVRLIGGHVEADGKRLSFQRSCDAFGQVLGIHLNEYQRVNLVALLNALGYPANGPGEGYYWGPSIEPFPVFNTGDWVGEIHNLINGPDLQSYEANVSAADIIQELQRPIPMILHCPKCGTQHVDKAEPEKGWDNPPHKSHLCHDCDTIWRPADVYTTGVATIETQGSADTWKP